MTSLSSLPLPGRVVNETCDAETETRPRRSKNARDRLEIDTTTLLPSTVGYIDHCKVFTVGVGTQSTLGRHDIFARKYV